MILILDDDKDIVEIMADYLEMSGNPILQAYIKVTSPQTAIHIIKNNKLDLIITDIMMPQLNGIELIKKITKHYPSTKIICVSGYSDLMLSELKKNKITFIEKPFTKKSFIDTIEKILEK